MLHLQYCLCKMKLFHFLPGDLEPALLGTGPKKRTHLQAYRQSTETASSFYQCHHNLEKQLLLWFFTL